MKSLVPTWEKINKLGRTMVLAAQETLQEIETSQKAAPSALS